MCVASALLASKFWYLSDDVSLLVRQFLIQNPINKGKNTNQHKGVVELNHIPFSNKNGFEFKDLHSFVGETWLTGNALSMGIYSVARRQPFGDFQPCTVFDTCLYAHMTGNPTGISNPYSFEATLKFTSLLCVDYLERDIVFPVHLPGHYISVIISYEKGFIAVIYPYHTTQSIVLSNIMRWYLDEYARLHGQRPIRSSRFNINNWVIFNGSSLPIGLTKQPYNDTWSCGPITAAIICNWIQYRELLWSLMDFKTAQTCVFTCFIQLL